MSRGHFITFEGGEGTGKTTQSQKLEAFLSAKGYEVVLTREPGGTAAGEALRDAFVTHKGQNWPLTAQTLLMFTARHLHFEQKIKPALEAGAIVVCDRFTDSTLAYQGYALGYDLENFKALNTLVMNDFEPDLTFVFDIDPYEGLIRASGRGNDEDTFEDMNVDFHEKLRRAYLKIAEDNPKRCHVLDAGESMDAIESNIAETVQEYLDRV